MLLNNDSHVQGIFKYSDDINFEKGDFVVEGNCIYICTSSEPVKKKLPSKNPDYYTAYPGDKIVTSEEYYNYINNRDGEDKYVSSYALCDILENMYFGFGDNGLITDHIIYNPSEGIEYSIRSVREILDNYTPNILDRVLQTENLNNGLVKISRNIKEICNILQENYNSETFESDVVILRQYTYYDTTKVSKFRIQELVDPEKNKMYFRFSKGETVDNTTHYNSASPWKNIYSNDEDIINKLNTIEDYYITKTQELQDLYNKLKGKYCYRSVDIDSPGPTVSLIPGGTKDIKSIESFSNKSCFLDIIIKSPIDGVDNLYKNYSITIDTKDIVDANNSTESYQLGDDIILTGLYYTSGGYETIGLTVSPDTCIIKDIYYRDYTLGHIHDWRLETTLQPATCTAAGWGVYHCDLCGEDREDIIDQLRHDMTKHEGYSATCMDPGQHTYYTCSHEPVGVYYMDESGTSMFTGWDTGDYPVVIPALGGENHHFGDWHIVQHASCTNDGIQERECELCGYIEQEIIPSTGHNLIEEPRKEPTCGETGNIQYWKCTNCGKAFSDNTGDDIITDEDSITLLATGNHDLSDRSHITVITPPTYSDDEYAHKGIGLIKCRECGNYVETELDFLQHDIDPQISSRYNHVAATCETDEYEEAICDCHNDLRKNIRVGSALGHQVIPEAGNINYVQADCASGTPGFWKGDCIVCGEHDVVQYDIQNGSAVHQIDPSDSLTRYRPNSCNRSAYWVGTCTVCNGTHVRVDDDTHGPVGHPDSDNNGICDVCGDNRLPSTDNVNNI